MQGTCGLLQTKRRWAVVSSGGSDRQREGKSADSLFAPATILTVLTGRFEQ